jgi:hypothetical protein
MINILHNNFEILKHINYNNILIAGGSINYLFY